MARVWGGSAGLAIGLGVAVLCATLVEWRWLWHDPLALVVDAGDDDVHAGIGDVDRNPLD
ncbi:hypothetical protein [Chloroflexus sp.]|uniref:hypothetical protein n=1 Tax=Chloroflexus sp. TaxID=1904827 RepID=UPI00259123E4|nr:hypothetical protein [Chloroflexus sp.]